MVPPLNHLQGKNKNAYADGCAAYAVGCAAYAESCAAYVQQCKNKAISAFN